MHLYVPHPAAKRLAAELKKRFKRRGEWIVLTPEQVDEIYDMF
jgi:hypothetical protein